MVWLQLKIVSEAKKNLSWFFHRIKYIVFKSVIKKNVYSAIVPHIFLTDSYCMVNFDRICL